MADENDRTQEEKMNEENDAREEDIVRDDDADTRDVEDSEREDSDEIEKRFSTLEATLDKILGEISSIREAQGIMVENGAVISEPAADIDFTDADSFVPPAEMDLLI